MDKNCEYHTQADTRWSDNTNHLEIVVTNVLLVFSFVKIEMCLSIVLVNLKL